MDKNTVCEMLPKQYRTSSTYPKKNGKMMILGWDEGHISRVVHRYLLQPGIFQIFRNDEGDWESYKPWLHKDIISKDRIEDSPPLLPERMIERIARLVTWLWRDEHRPDFEEHLSRALEDDERITLRVSTLERALRSRG